MYRDCMKTHPEGTMCKKRQAVPREACSAHSLPLDFQTSEQWQNKCVALLLSHGVCYDSLAIKLLGHFTQPTCSNWPSTAFAHLVINPKAQITWLMFSVGTTCFDYILTQLASLICYHRQKSHTKWMVFPLLSAGSASSNVSSSSPA